jgi:hypothetical protein
MLKHMNQLQYVHQAPSATDPGLWGKCRYCLPTADEIDVELAAVLKYVYQQGGEEGFTWLTETYHRGNPAEFDELLQKLGQKELL